MNNNRKRTKGRKIQAINVALKIKSKTGELIDNPSPYAGKMKFIRHL